MKMCFLLIVTAVLWTVAAHGQGRDYTAGIERFFRMGLPDVSEAEYGVVSARHPFLAGHDDWEWRRFQFGGNAWRLDPPGAGKATYLYNSGRIITMYEPAELARLQRESAREDGLLTDDRQRQPIPELRISGQFTPVDLEGDIQTLLAFLKDDSGPYGIDQNRLKRIAGRIFVFAALVHNHGRVEKAQELLDALFAVAPDPQDVILDGLSHIASEQYASAYIQWRQDQDWEAYRERIEHLLQMFRNAWILTPAVELVRDSVNARLDLDESLMVPGLNEAEQKLARALIHASPLPGRQRHGLWIFPGSLSRQHGAVAMPSLDADHPVQAIKEMGPDAIPLLLALLNDRIPTLMDWHELAGIFRVTYYMDRTEAWIGEGLRAIHDYMSRPATRGDVARALLFALVQNEQMETVVGQSPEAIRMATEEWLARVGDRSLAEIARLYMEEGTGRQRIDAGEHLLLSEDPGDVAFVEQILREAADPTEWAALAIRYAMLKRSGSEELLAEFAERLGPAIGNLDEERRREVRGLTRTLNRLKTVLAGESLETYVDAVVAGQEEFSRGRLLRLMGQTPMRDRVGALLRGAVAVDDPNLRHSFISPLLIAQHWRIRLLWRDEGSPDEEMGDWTPQEFAAEWRQLLEDDAVVIPAGHEYPMTIRFQAAQALLWLSLSDTQREGGYFELLPVAGRPVEEFFVDWANHLLDDPYLPLPDMPSVADVSDERREEIQRWLAESDDERANLSVAERMFVHHQLGREPGMAAAVLDYANRLTAVRPLAGAAEDEELAERLVSPVFNAAWIESIRAEVHGRVEAGESIAVHVFRHPALGGIEIWYGAVDADEATAVSGLPHVSGSISTREQRLLRARWITPSVMAERVGPALAPRRESEADADDVFGVMLHDLDAQLAESSMIRIDTFWEIVQALATGAIGPQEVFLISFHGSFWTLSLN